MRSGDVIIAASQNRDALEKVVVKPLAFFPNLACYRNGQRMAPFSFKHVVGRASWEVHAHRYATRAWRAASSGHILDKSSPFAKVVAHLLLIVNLAFRGRASR